MFTVKYHIMKYIFITLLVITISFSFRSIETEKSPLERYSTVKVFIKSADDIRTLQMNDIEIEHFRGGVSEGITVVINQEELRRLENTGLQYEVTIPDMDEYYNNRQQPSDVDMLKSEFVKSQDNVNSFGYGSMGGYYTFNEVVQKLDSMRLQYPNLISLKQEIATTTEGRKVWMVKISDNPDVNESATESAIYFDALHHAREPQSMASLMYFMYWLLDNYASNPEAAYIVNNREVFFIPVVNPDGYYYNQSTNPNGGGGWRKNRRNNGSSFGVDLNRNYSYKWGYDNIGSSNTPSSETYRGPSAASEPEILGIQNFVNTIHPQIAFSMHSVAERVLNPYGYADSIIIFDKYSEFASDFTSNTYYLYGTVSQMLSYTSNGTTRDYFQSIGSMCWVVECAGSDFWPLQSEIFPIASVNLKMFKYLSLVGGAKADMHNYFIVGKGYAEKNDTLELQVGVKNKGLSQTARNVTVTLSTNYPNAVSLVSSVNYDSIPARDIKSNTLPFKFRLTNSAALLDEISFTVNIKQEGVEVDVDTLKVVVGKTNVIFFDNAENGIGNWVRSGNQIQWDTSFCDSWSGSKSFADSRYGNSKNSTNNQFTTSNLINLSNTVNPRLEFFAKWAVERSSSSVYDYARIQVSSNNGSSWTSLPGRYTVTGGGQPSYSGIQKWVKESINLDAYKNQNVKFRFTLYTDSGEPGDGFYFDDFKIVDYSSTATVIAGIQNEIPERFNLYQNFPNPFNPVTQIKFDVAKTSFVKLVVFDVLGREVQTLINKEVTPGFYSLNWDASLFNSGIYFLKMSAGSFSGIKRLVLVK